MSTAERDDWLSLLAYVIAPVVGALILLSDATKNQPRLRQHAVQSLMLSGALGALCFVFLMCGAGCFLPLVWFGPLVYFGLKAYRETPFVIPVLTDYARNQNWF